MKMATETLTITVRFDDESLEALKALTAAFKGSADAPTPKDMKPAEKPAAEKKPADKKPPAEKKAEKPKDDAPTIDREMIRGKLKELGAIEGQGPALAILKKFGAATMGALKEEDFQAAYDAVCAALKTAKPEEPAADADPFDT